MKEICWDVVKENMFIIDRIVNKTTLPSRVSKEEAKSAGLDGLIQATKNYDGDGRFQAFAGLAIWGAIKTEIRKTGHTIKTRISNKNTVLVYPHISMDATHADEEKNLHNLLYDTSQISATKKSEYRELYDFIKNLRQDRKEILIAHYFRALSCPEIGKRRGMSGSLVWWHLNEAIKELRSYYGVDTSNIKKIQRRNHGEGWGILKCSRCGKKVEVKLSRHQKYCSMECYQHQRNPPVSIKCKYCGKEIKIRSSKKGITKFCSVECRFNYRRQLRLKKAQYGLSRG